MTNRPEFLVIGAQKCATTWLYKCLREHPELYLPPYKRDVDHLASQEYQEKGIEHYFRHFEGARKDQKIADVSVEYLFDASCAELVYRHIPDPKFIVSLRNPVERAISAYSWHIRKGFIPDLPLDEGMQRVINQNGNNYSLPAKQIYQDILERGFYDLQLERYLKYFDVNNFLFVLYDKIQENPDEVIERIYEFIGVSRSYRPTNIESRPLASTYIRPIFLLERLFAAPPGKQWSPSRRAVTKIIDTSNQWMLKFGFTPTKPRLSEQLRQEMRAIYRPHVQQLKKILLQAPVVGDTLLSHLPDLWK